MHARMHAQIKGVINHTPIGSMVIESFFPPLDASFCADMVASATVARCNAYCALLLLLLIMKQAEIARPGDMNVSIALFN
jgi:hypothetical protein